MNTPLYQAIATAVDARQRCDERGNSEWEQRWTDRLEWIGRNILPSGSGFDNGTTVDVDRSRPDRLVLNTSFHHMDEYGGYDGWTEHAVIVRPSLIHGFELRVDGRDRNGIKDYIADVFNALLHEIGDWTTDDRFELVSNRKPVASETDTASESRAI